MANFMDSVFERVTRAHRVNGGEHTTTIDVLGPVDVMGDFLYHVKHMHVFCASYSIRMFKGPLYSGTNCDVQTPPQYGAGGLAD